MIALAILGLANVLVILAGLIWHQGRQHPANRDANLDRVVLEFARGRKLSSHTKAR